MTSTYLLTIILCGFFVMIYKQPRKEVHTFTWKQVLLCAAFTRGLTVLALEYKELSNLACLAIDLFLCTLLYFYKYKLMKKTEDDASKVSMCYLFCPMTMIGVLWADVERMVLIAIAVIALMAVDFLLAKLVKAYARLSLLATYRLFSASCFFYFLASDEYGQSIYDVTDDEEAFPVLIIIGLVLMGCSFISFLISWIFAVKQKEELQTQTSLNSADDTDARQDVYTGVSKWDVLWILLLTGVFAVTAFIHLGSTTAPQTEQLLHGNDKESELIIDLGEQHTIREIVAFNGYLGERELSISYFDEAMDEWVVVNSNTLFLSCFRWNHQNVDMTCRYVGVVSRDEDAYFRELIFIDDEGKVITPVMDDSYAALFDEQELYPSEDTCYYSTMFDEIYHGRTAYELIHDLPIYETTHPPFGKIMISLGIRLFGMTPFGWRFITVIFGTLMVPIIYLFALRLTRKTSYAVLAGVLSITEFMHYALSRIATIDVIVAFFFLAMFYFMYLFVDDLHLGKSEKTQWLHLLLAGIMSGFAVATKWTGLYAMAGIAVIFFGYLICDLISKGGLLAHKQYLIRLFGVCVASFIVIPLVIYVLSYLPFLDVEEGNIFAIIWDNAQYMFSYHKGVFDEHPYASVWYEWLIDKRPLLDAFDYVGDDKQSVIATFGNPFVMWVGLLALVRCFLLWWKERDQKALYLMLGYVSMLLPWVFIYRTVFIYQYFGCTLFLVLIIAYSVFSLKKWNRVAFGLAVTVSTSLFIMFFPVLSGIYVNREYFKLLKWFSTWPFV